MYKHNKLLFLDQRSVSVLFTNRRQKNNNKALLKLAKQMDSFVGSSCFKKDVKQFKFVT